MGAFEERLIVIPTDLSEFSIRALQIGVEIATRRELIRVVHVMPMIEPIHAEGNWISIDEAARLEQTRENVQAFLDVHQFGDLPYEVLLGDAGHEITNYASECNAGLIVIPSHGRGMLQRLLLGSTTNRVVHLAHCPILVLRPERQPAKPSTKE